MKHKKIIAVLLTLTMIAGSLPAAVLADGTAAEEITEEVSEVSSDEGSADEESGEEEGCQTAEILRNGNDEGDVIPDDAIHVKSADDFGTLTDGCYILNGNKTYILDKSITTAGRIYIGENAEVTIDLNRFTINRGLTAPVEGGSVIGVGSEGTLTVKNGTVTGGYRASGNGGGFNVDPRATLILENVVVEDNKAEHAGGGIYANGSMARVTLKGDCMVKDNTAGTYGGGIFVSSTDSAVSLEGTCSVTGNKAGTNGSGIYVSDHACLNIKDEPLVTDNGSENVYLAAGCQIGINGELREDTRIGVTHYDEGAAPFTTGYGNYTHAGDPEEMFFCDGCAVVVAKDRDVTAGEKEKELWSAYKYISRSWDATERKIVENECEVTEYTPLNRITLSGDDTVDLINDNWYVVRKDVRLDHVVRCFIGANILLCDGTTLTCNQGIVAEDNNVLNIYGQSEDEGILIAKGRDDYAGIGSGKEKPAGHINIYGGTVRSTGGKWAAGIGGGDLSSCGDLAIYGGVIEADGGQYAPGIGSGQKSPDLGTIRIYGGRITARGDNGAGIGASGVAFLEYKEVSGDIVICGGVINALGYGASGIGAGESVNVNINITISGGTVTAESVIRDSDGAAGIGSGEWDYSGGGGDYAGTITISGGTVIARGSSGADFKGGAGIGTGYKGNMTGRIVITGGTVEATGGTGGAAIGGGGEGNCNGGKIDIAGGSLTLGIGMEDKDYYPVIGHGYSAGSYNGDLTISDGISVYYDGSLPVAADKRVSTCQNAYIDNTIKLHVETCDHSADRTYTVQDEYKHVSHCTYCSSTLVEDHEYSNGVCAKCGHTGLGERLAGYSLSLEGDIAVNYYMELSEETAGSSTAHMHFELPGGRTKDMYVSQAETKTLGGKTYHVFKCSVAAKNVNSEIKAYMADGSLTSTEYTFTVKDYADYLIAHTGDDTGLDKAVKDLAGALINYGAYAQVYFGITSDLEPVQIDPVTVNEKFKYDPANTELPGNVSFAGASLSLKSETTMSIYLKTDSDLHDIACVDQAGNAYLCEREADSNYIVLRIRNLAVTELDNLLTISFKAGDDDTVYHIGYYPLTYCYNILNGDYDEGLTNVCTALCKYWEEAEIYQALKEIN